MAEEKTPVNPLELTPSDDPAYVEAMLKIADEIDAKNNPNSPLYNAIPPSADVPPAPTGEQAEAKSGTTPDGGEPADAGKSNGGLDPAVLDSLPEKFRKAKDPLKALAMAYAQLESKLGSKKPDVPPAKEGSEGEGGDEGDKAGTPPDAGKAAADKAGLNFNELVEHYSVFGELAPEQYAALSAAGFDKSVVETYIAGQEAIAREQRSKLFADVGGEDKANELLEWAGKSLEKARIDEYNKLLSTNDPTVVSFTLRSIAKERESLTPPKVITGGSATAASESFESKEQIIAAMSDERYNTDPAYRRMVEEKMLKSQFFK